MAKRTIVEINGRQYDASTGKIVTETPTASRVIDGFQAPISAKKQPTQKLVSSRQVNAATSLHKAPQKTNKLHPAVAQKQVTPKTVASKSGVVQRAPQQASPDVSVPSSTAQSRMERAQSHQRSAHVTRFHAAQQEAPQQPAEPPVAQIPAEDIAPAQPITKPTQILKTKAPEPEAENEVATEKKPGALARLRGRRPKLLPVAMTTALLLMLGGYVAYQNIPNMALRVAAQRAGFNASLPGYSPSGFSFGGPVSYSDGIVELEYSSNSDDRNYKLIQRESSWDSQSLLDNFVLNTTSDYLTFQERGLTVYIYDSSNATWVDGGIWYTVEGNSLLSSEQLLKIAGSL